MDLSTDIAGLNINPAIMNASGIFSFPSVLEKISRFKIGALVTKSICLNEREGNENPVFVQCSDESWINAVGLPGPGSKLKKEELKEIHPHLKSINKPLITSIFESSKEKIANVANILEDTCDAFELNFSCPNLMPGEKTGIMIGRDPSLVESYTRAVRSITKKPIIVKLSPGPYLDDQEKIKAIAISAVNSGASAISAINTIPSGMKIDIHAKKPVLAAKYGGLSGRAIKPIGIGCVYTIYKAIPNEVPIIGIGGIATANDIIEYVEAGASAVAIGTAFVNKSLSDIENYLSDLVTNLEEILAELGVDKLRELRGIAHES